MGCNRSKEGFVSVRSHAVTWSYICKYFLLLCSQLKSCPIARWTVEFQNSGRSLKYFRARSSALSRDASSEPSNTKPFFAAYGAPASSTSTTVSASPPVLRTRGRHP